MNQHILSLIFIFCSTCSFATENKKPTVVVIGAGPAGLGAAIEAKEAGADVIVVEKRDSYTRLNALFLYTETLELFDKWQVKVNGLEELDFRGQRRGFVLIKDLEESLSEKVNASGIQRLRGEFKDFGQEERTAIIHTEEGDISLSYDILVGADGANSRVREKLRIPHTCSGRAVAGVAIVPAFNSGKIIDVDLGTHNDVFVKKVKVPSANIFFMQTRPESDVKKITQKELSRFASEMNWLDDSKILEAGEARFIENIPVYLQRSDFFSDSEKSVILLGEAAGCASLYQGTGANYAFKMVQIASSFFKQASENQDFNSFNHDMENLVEGLLENSRPLFEQ